jgi:type II secretory pathway component PulF
MTAWALGLAVAGALWSLGGGRRPWPWRVADLPDPQQVDHQRPAAALRHRGGGRGRRGCRSTIRGRPAGRRADRGADDLVTVIDQLHVTVSAGHSLHSAIAVVADVEGGPVASALAGSHAAFARGRTMADALAPLGAVGPDVDALQATLVAALHSGAAPGPALQRLGDQLRRRRRRQAESRVRRLPVLLLAPLVGLVLPAFVVVTIVPVALTTARAGLLPASA